LREIFNEAAKDFTASKAVVPDNLHDRVRDVLERHHDLRWDDALQLVIDKSALDDVREKKQKAKKTSGDFTDDNQ
jgi:hypothetical protein